MADPPSGFINLDTILEDNSPQAEEVIVSYAVILGKNRITLKNAPTCLKLLSLNNNRAADAIIGDRDPFLLFSTINPDRKLMISAFQILSSYRPSELYIKIFHACIGLLLNGFSSPGSVNTLYQPSVSDIRHTAKYLSVPEISVQEKIIDFLYKLADIKSLSPNLLSFITEIISVYFDNTKNLDSIIPAALL